MIGRNFNLIYLMSVGSTMSVLGYGSEYSQSKCYVAPSCTATTSYDKVTGFTNNTGWDLYEDDLCCQICLPGTPPTVCFDSSDADCKSKTGNGDYDFLLLSQMWQPQFCSSLSNGHDPTLTHLMGTECTEDAPSGLRIHGLWPNYFNGYPQCCNSTTAPSYTLQPSEVISWSIYPELQKTWAGVSSMDTCSVCSMLNHEWLKHGGCYSPGDPVAYFTNSILISDLIESSSLNIESLEGSVVETSFLESLYTAKVNVLCDPHSNYNSDTGKLLELRTCWTRELQPIDCPPSSAGQFTAPCPEYTLIPKNA